MSIIKIGTTYKIYSSDVELMGEGLPAKTYGISFNPMSGFSLYEKEDLKCKEEKTYGNHREKARKIVNTFRKINRNLGVLISGDKGIGKTMTVQILAEMLSEKNIPTIIVDENYSGLHSFIESISQPCMFVFDEFEKKFPETRSDSNGCSQEDLLSLFDGLTGEKHLYAVTVNNVGRLNSYFMNRPGRFHYHIRYDYPNREEIKEYFLHHNPDISNAEVDEIVAIGSRTKLNFDMLRAISLELSLGYSVKEAFEDLNINITDEQSKKVVITTTKRTFIEAANTVLFGVKQQIEFEPYGRYSSETLYGDIFFEPGALTMNNSGLSLDISKITKCDVYILDEKDDNDDYIPLLKEDIISIKIEDNHSVVRSYLL